MKTNQILQGDVLDKLKDIPDEFVDCIITSPPYYGLRDYSVDGQIGLEKILQEYLDKMLLITGELKRVLKNTGTMWWNHGDSYASKGNEASKWAGDGKLSKKEHGWARIADYPEKSLLLQAHRLAIQMIDEQGWILRNTIIWHKPNCMPSSVKDRFTVDYEPVFFFSKSKKYWFETQYEKAETPGSVHKVANRGKSHEIHDSVNATYSTKTMITGENRNKRSVWRIPTKPFPEAHFAVFPEALIETPIKAGCPEGGIVLDPFMGAGTTAVVAKKLRRQWLGIELNPEYIEIAMQRINAKSEPML